VSSVTRSAMSKRRRTAGQVATGASRECPICFEQITARTQANPFSCDHAVCVTCHARLIEMDDHRCPTCRAPRLGLTAEEAEPPPDRNHASPIEMPPMLEEFLQTHGHMLSHAASPYGLQSQGAAARYHGRQRVARPDTGHIMFFPMQPPSNAAPTLDPFVSGAIPGNLLQNSGLGEEAHTLAALSSVMPHSLVQALLNLPDMPTLEEWHAVRRNAQPPQPPPAPPPTRGRGPVRRPSLTARSR